MPVDKTVEPETDYTLTPEACAIAEAMTADIDEILDAPLRPDEMPAEPDPEQLERMAAFSLREDR